MIVFVKKNWFIIGLMCIFFLILFDISGMLTTTGKWIKDHHGPSLVMFTIFLCSGLMLDANKLRECTGDTKGLLTAIGLIFVFAPVLAFVLGKTPLPHGVVIGFFIVSTAPTTLSSGVVMTTAAGGNMAHALLVTLVSNSLAIVTVPLTLPLLLRGWQTAGPIVIDRNAMIVKIGCFVLVPLMSGLLLRWLLKISSNRPVMHLQTINQTLILVMVAIGLSQARDVLLASGWHIPLIIFLVAFFHVAMLIAAKGLGRFLHLSPMSRISVLFMGSQKTLPLTLMVQVAAFPAYPLALVVCVLHHLMQLFLDGYLVGRISKE